MRVKCHFNIDGLALSLALKQRFETTAEWPIGLLGLYMYHKEYSRHVFLVHTLSLLSVIEIFVQLIHCLSLCQDDRFPYLCYFPTGALGQAGHVTNKLPVSHQA